MDDETWRYYREEAMMWAAERDQAFQDSQKAYKRGDGSMAKTTSNYGKLCGKKCDESNKLAANAIFVEMNADRPLTEIDLHGLFLSEAIEKLEDRVIYALNHGMERLDVIVGQGHHSEGGAKLKPGVMQFATDNRIRYKLNERNPGCILFHFGRSAAVSSSTPRDDYWPRTPQRSTFTEQSSSTDWPFWVILLFLVGFSWLVFEVKNAQR